MSEILKPCPFCGVEAEYLGTYEDEDGFKLHQVGCPSDLCIGDCFAIGVTKKQAIEAWNKRPNPWHTGTPTEDGDYFVAYHWGLDNKIMHDMASRILYGATTFENGNWKIDYPYVVTAWQKIEPYREGERK